MGLQYLEKTLKDVQNNSILVVLPIHTGFL